MSQPQIQLTRDRENRIALFGRNYVENQETEQGTEQDAATANSINNIEERIGKIEEMVEQSLRNQQDIAQGVDDVQQGVGELQTGQERVGNQIDNFRRKALAGIGALADNGGSWLDNCFPLHVQKEQL